MFTKDLINEFLNSFQVSASTTNAALVSNSRNTQNCQTASLEVYLEGGQVGAKVVNINGGSYVLQGGNGLVRN